MSVWEHSRHKIFNISQHPYNHDLSEFEYVNEKLPVGILRVSDVLDYIVNVLYPNSAGTVNTPSELPPTANPNDYYFVKDDGDGHGAGYVYTVINGIGKWVKRYDVDWNLDHVLSETVNRTQYLYAAKYGITDKDENGNDITGFYAGQTVYGGDQANQSFTLVPNTTGIGGYIQFEGTLRPTNSSFDLGTTLLPFAKLYASAAHIGTTSITPGLISDSTDALSFGSCTLTTTGNLFAQGLTASSFVHAGTLTIQSGSISDSSGNISFGSDNLTTLGTITAASGSQLADLTFSNDSITSSTGSISFGSNNLTTTGSITGDSANLTSAVIGLISFTGASIHSGSSDLTLGTDNGFSVIVASPITAGNINATAISGTSLQIDHILIDGNTVKATDTNGNLYLQANGTGLIEFNTSIYPATSGYDIGKAGNEWNKLWITGSIGGATEITLADLLSLRNTPYRDLARLTPAQSGDTLFWDAVNGVWLASHPDTEVLHSEISGLTTDDAGHTQFVMLAGRSGGQTIQGGSASNDSLVFESTSHATKGYVYTKDTFKPLTDAAYSAGWSGVDLGGSTNRFRDIYSRGEFKGFRFENALSTALPSASATTIGRTVFNTDTKKIQVDIGGAWINAGTSKFIQDLSFNGTDLIKDVDVSGSIYDARNAIWQLCDNSNSFEVLLVAIRAISATTVRIITSIPLEAGTYRLKGIE